MTETFTRVSQFETHCRDAGIEIVCLRDQGDRYFTLKKGGKTVGMNIYRNRPKYQRFLNFSKPSQRSYLKTYNTLNEMCHSVLKEFENAPV